VDHGLVEMNMLKFFDEQDLRQIIILVVE